MKRAAVSMSLTACAATVLLSLTLLMSAGCSNERTGGDGTAEPAANLELDRSEIHALKKAHKNRKEFDKAALEKRLEKLKALGVTFKTTTSPKTTKRPH